MRWRICRKCFDTLPMSAFGLDCKGTGGHKSVCKLCRSKGGDRPRFDSKSGSAAAKKRSMLAMVRKVYRRGYADGFADVLVKWVEKVDP